MITLRAHAAPPEAIVRPSRITTIDAGVVIPRPTGPETVVQAQVSRRRNALKVARIIVERIVVLMMHVLARLSSSADTVLELPFASFRFLDDVHQMPGATGAVQPSAAHRADPPPAIEARNFGRPDFWIQRLARTFNAPRRVVEGFAITALSAIDPLAAIRTKLEFQSRRHGFILCLACGEIKSPV
jgi:hypothetical protein